MVRDAGLLLRLYWRLNRRERGGLSIPVRIVYYLLALILIIISALAGYAAGLVVGNPFVPITLGRGTAPGLFLTIVLIGLLFTGFNQALRALFLSGDLERLMVAPVSTPAVMTAKLLSRLPGTTFFLLAITLPALLTYGIGVGEGPLYYLAGVLLLLVAPLFGLSVGALAALLLVRFMPARRLNEYVGAAYIILSMLIVLAFQAPRFLVNNPQAGAQTLQALENTIETFEKLPLPSMWAGQGLDDLGSGRFADSLGGITIYLLMTVGLFAITVLVADRLYLTGWLRMQGSGIRRQGFEEDAGIFGGESLDASLAFKDWLLRFRDLRQLATFAVGIIFAVVFAAIFLLGTGNNDGGLLDQARRGSLDPQRPLITVAFSPGVIVSAMILWIGWSAFSQVATTSLAMEGRAFYLLKAAPVGPGRVLRAKSFAVIIPYAVIATLLLIVSWFLFRFSLAWMPYAWLCLLIIGYGLLAFSTGVGFVYANLEWEDPRAMLQQRGRWFSLAGSGSYGLLTGLLALAPFILSSRFPAASPLFVIAGLALLAAITWFFVGRQNRRAIKAWATLGEP
jgi:ABC-2 type transport system permease protein